ncbi:N-formylglutamate amidohydrolase [Sneathiella chinensis]|uniref:N-formylglutamate amidohydrolase n=1 Tax=Sneathiella chinensis TaxID=349750 RepID=A0ABQ5U0U3_9PROT|nr:N-formylglutamate amidohydrolase [Sneathiella chinensis]GLQ05737.1 N-formylglutamate amidohydrolase [Sneathiella chinensis]
MKTLFSEKPLEILRPTDWTLPVVLSSPHSGRQYPAPFTRLSRLDINTLRQSEDFLVDELFSSAPSLGAPLIKATFPRVYCDVNRQPFELDPDMYRDTLPDYVTTRSVRLSAGIGTIPKVVTAGKIIHARPLAFSDAEARLANCYFPYHHHLKGLLEEGLNRFGAILLLDCHSMPGQSGNRTNGARLPDMVIGDRFGASCAPHVSRMIGRTLKQAGYSVRFNAPYAGGYITRHYGSLTPAISAVQIEINRDLYMCPRRLSPIPGMDRLKSDLSALIATVGAQLDQAAPRRQAV